MSTSIPEIAIVNRRIGFGYPCFVIAEAGVNHNGDMEIAEKLIAAAAEAGADAVKFQTFVANRLVTRDAAKAEYQKKTTGASESQYAMLSRLELSSDDHRRIMDCCKRHGILFLSTPFDEESADLLEALGVPAFKIPSGEITNLPYLEHIARKGLPVILSTGMSTIGEVATAIEAIEKAGDPGVVLLHCVSNYPTDPKTVNLRAMATMSSAFTRPVGFSDHTMGLEIAFAAVALGACLVEKHLTLDRTMPGPDHQASLEPGEMAALVRGIRHIEVALGDGRKQPSASEANTAAVARKSLVAACDIAAGATLTAQMLAIMRPGTGLPPALRPAIVGRTLRVAVPAGTVLNWEMFV
jgi:N-acetylneuraminate synthase